MSVDLQIAIDSEIKILEQENISKEQLSIMKEVEATKFNIEFTKEDNDIVKEDAEDETVIKREAYKTTS